VKVSYDKWNPVVQPMASTQQDVFIKRIEKLNAERAIQVQVEKQVVKFHQYEYEIYEYRMRQISLNIQIANLKRDIDLLI